MSKPAPLTADLLGVPKGAAAPSPDVQAAAPDVPPARDLDRRPVLDYVPPVEEIRTALTVRLPIGTQERLREAAHRTRREKQAIVDEALAAWLAERGF